MLWLPATARNCALAFGPAAALLLPFRAPAQTLVIEDDIRTHAALTNIVVTLTGRAELRLSGTGDPLPGCMVHLNSPDAWLRLTAVTPSQVAATLLGRVRVYGAPAVRDSNVRVAQYAQGAFVIPHAPDFAPLEVFDGRYFTGPSLRLLRYTAYDNARLGAMSAAIQSFKLKRGYMATFAQQEGGGGVSRCYVAQDGDLEVGRLPSALENSIRFVRVFPWRWVSKKGIAGNIEAGLNVAWLYNWNLDRNSPLDWEYVPIRQTRWWPSLDQDWSARGATHLLGYNEPDRPDQADLSVSDAIAAWPDVLGPGLRVGAPAVSDGGLNWLYDFMAQAEAAGLRVDFVPVHYYRCYGNAGDANGAATQFYNFLKGVHDVVKRPLWVTEWNNGATWTSCADPTFAQQQAAVAAMLDMLDSTPFVERYALYNWVEDVRRVKWDDGSLTAAGQTYRDQAAPLAYRQEMADAGTGSSARYAFEGQGHDGWGNGQDAMLVGTPSFVPGQSGLAIALDGQTDYLQLSPRLADSTDFTFAGWVYWGGGGNWQRIFDFGEDTSRFLFLTPRSSAGTLRFGIQNGGAQQQLNSPALPVGVWTHLAVTLAGDTGKLFVNGVAVATNTAMTINPSDVGTQFNYLGKSRFTADPLFHGRFDDFRFMSSALTDAQVAAIATTLPPQFRSTPLLKPDAAVGAFYSATLAGDVTGGAGALTFSKMDGPAWLSVAPDGRLAGLPTLAHGGVNRFLVRVTDTHGSLSTTLLTIAVPTVSVALAAGADDAEESAAGTVSLTSTDLELVNDGTAGDQIIGLRFAGLGVPPGALVTNATIQFTADESQSGPTVLDIFAQAADNAAPFTAAANNLRSRPRTAHSVLWQPAPWTAGQAGADQRTPNLAGLVQEVVSRPGWSAGNALVFLISGAGHRTAEAFDKPGGSPPRLSVAYTTATPLHSLSLMITGSANDAEQSAAGVVSLTSTDLELVNDDGTGAGNQTVGLRFENLALPAGAVIASAKLQFTADEIQSETTTLTLRAQAADHAAVFSTNANDLGARPLTTGSVTWTPAAWTTVGERGPPQRSPDLAALVREVVARPGWQTGNALAFLISGAGHRTAEAVDKAGGTPAILTITYWLEPPLGSYLRWSSGFTNLGPPSADFDGDGYDQWFEYALGLDPTVPDTGALQLTLDGAQLTLAFTRPSSALDVSYQLEWCDDLGVGAWSAANVTTRIVADDGVRRSIQTSLPAGNSGQRFVRLKVTAH
jgi:hypothetical protein